jgi:hypothetical protein
MSILIGLHIKRVLGGNKDVVKFVDDRIFPIAVPNGVSQFPFICYDTNGTSGQSTKDGFVNDMASVGISVIGKNYEEVIVIGNLIRRAFERKRVKYEEFEVIDCMNIVYNDEYIADIDSYSLNLSMDFKTKDN